MASKDMALMIGVGAPKDEESAAGAPLDNESDPRAAAGKALASALRAGDGAAIAAAFEELLTQIDGGGEEEPMGPEMMDSEPSPF